MTTKRKRGRVSVSMIVRNEERVLARCLSSLKGACDEICIVDTGSTDNTVSIARHFGAKVQTVLDCNGPDGKMRDFALARNVSFDMATGDFILWIDADEVLGAGGAKYVRRHALNGAVAGVRVSMREGATRWFSTRLVRNDPRHRFVGRIHEYVSLEGDVLHEPNIVIRNRPDKAGKESSHERTIRISEEMLEEAPDNKRVLFYLANALKSAGRLDEAIARYTQYLELGGNFRCERHMAAQQRAVCHLLRAEWQLAIDAAFHALSIDPRYAETHCVLGDAFGALGEIGIARQWFRSALTVKAPPAEATLFIDPAAYGQYPRERVRQCDQMLGDVGRKQRRRTA